MARWDHADLLNEDTKAFLYPEYSNNLKYLRESAVHHRKLCEKLSEENRKLKKQLLKYQQEELARREHLDHGY